jgi:hypothetical protein
MRGERSFEAEAMFLLTFAGLVVAVVSVLRSLRVRAVGPAAVCPSALEQTHTDGVVVGALALPIVCIALVTSGVGALGWGRGRCVGRPIPPMTVWFG